MKKKLKIISLIITLIIHILAGCGGKEQATIPAEKQPILNGKVEFITIPSGYINDQYNYQTKPLVLYGDAEIFLQSRAFGEYSVSREDIAMIFFMGEAPTSGYYLEVEKLELENGVLNAYLKVIEPEHTATVSQVITYPRCGIVITNNISFNDINLFFDKQIPLPQIKNLAFEITDINYNSFDFPNEPGIYTYPLVSLNYIKTLIEVKDYLPASRNLDISGFEVLGVTVDEERKTVTLFMGYSRSTQGNRVLNSLSSIVIEVVGDYSDYNYELFWEQLK